MGLVYTSIRARNVKRSVDFYTKQMGLKVVERRKPIPGEESILLEDRKTGAKLRIMWYGRNCRLYKPYTKGEEMDHLMFEVNDAEKEYNRLVRNGARVAMKLFQGKEVKMGFVYDPDGIWVGLKSKA